MQWVTELLDRWYLSKLVLVVFVSLALVGATSCGGGEDEQGGDEPAQEEQQQEQEDNGQDDDQDDNQNDDQDDDQDDG
jgi:hypothetical protein